MLTFLLFSICVWMIAFLCPFVTCHFDSNNTINFFTVQFVHFPLKSRVVTAKWFVEVINDRLNDVPYRCTDSPLPEFSNSQGIYSDDWQGYFRYLCFGNGIAEKRCMWANLKNNNIPLFASKLVKRKEHDKCSKIKSNER